MAKAVGFIRGEDHLGVMGDSPRGVKNFQFPEAVAARLSEIASNSALGFRNPTEVALHAIRGFIMFYDHEQREVQKHINEAIEAGRGFERATWGPHQENTRAPTGAEEDGEEG